MISAAEAMPVGAWSSGTDLELVKFNPILGKAVPHGESFRTMKTGRKVRPLNLLNPDSPSNPNEYMYANDHSVFPCVVQAGPQTVVFQFWNFTTGAYWAVRKPRSSPLKIKTVELTWDSLHRQADNYARIFENDLDKGYYASDPEVKVSTANAPQSYVKLGEETVKRLSDPVNVQAEKEKGKSVREERATAKAGKKAEAEDGMGFMAAWYRKSTYARHLTRAVVVLYG
jgi:hypothetical protein